MAQIVNAGFQQLQSPYGDLASIGGQAAGSAASQAFTQGMAQRERQNLQGLQAQAAMLEQKYPTSQGGLARALRQPETAAIAAQDIRAYYDALGRATGRKFSEADVAQGVSGFAQGFISPEGYANAIAGRKFAQNVRPEATPPAIQDGGDRDSMIPAEAGGSDTATGPAKAAPTRPAPPLAPVPPNQPVPMGYQRAPYPEGPNYDPAVSQLPSTQYSGVPVQAAPSNPLAENPYQAKGFVPVAGGVQGSYQSAPVSPEEAEANRQAVIDAITPDWLYKSDAKRAREATVPYRQEERNPYAASKALEQSATYNQGNRPASEPRTFTPGAGRPTAQALGEFGFQIGEQQDQTGTYTSNIPSIEDIQRTVSPEEAQAQADAVAPPQADGSRVVPAPGGKGIALDKQDLKEVSNMAKVAAGFLDAEFKNPETKNAGRFARVVEKFTKEAPGAKEFSDEWTNFWFDTIRNASPQELAALGLDEKAKIVIDDNRNRVAAEQNWVAFSNAMTRAGVDMAQTEMQRRISMFDNAIRVFQADGTAKGAKAASAIELFKTVFPKAVEAATDKNGKFDEIKYNKFFDDKKLTDLKDWASGYAGDTGGVRVGQSPTWFGLSSKDVLTEVPPADASRGPGGATRGAARGQAEAGLGAAPPSGESPDADRAGYFARVIQNTGTDVSMQDLVKQNLDELYKSMSNVYGGRR